MNQVFTFNEALEASKIYFDGDELAAKVWVNKYALKDSNGNIYEKTPTDMPVSYTHLTLPTKLEV